MKARIRLVVLGERNVGQKTLLHSFATSNNHTHDISVDGSPCSLLCAHTSRGEEFDPTALTFKGRRADVFLLCFSVVDPSSFMEVLTKWWGVLSRHCENTPFILVGTKIDLRHNPDETERLTSQGFAPIAHAQGLDMAKAIKAHCYMETSGITHQGVSAVFAEAARAVITPPVDKTGRRKPKDAALVEHDRPVLPGPIPAPRVEIASSAFGSNRASLVDKATFSDVSFRCEGGKVVHAHKVLLCSSSATPLFRYLFNCRTKAEQAGTVRIAFDGYMTGLDQLNLDVNADSGPEKTVFKVSDTIEAETILAALEFIYSGSLKLRQAYALDRVLALARAWAIEPLEEYCRYPRGSVVPESITTEMLEQTGKIGRELFYDNTRFADVWLVAENEKFPAHRALLACRSDVLSIMASGSFVEASSAVIEIKETDGASFQALVEYLYTDHAPFDDRNPIGLLMLGNRFNIPHLISLCEVNLGAAVEKSTAESVDIDLIGLLNLAQENNAGQLAKVCLHTVARYYKQMKKRPEWTNLSKSDAAYVEKYQWPPVSYQRQCKEYETHLREYKLAKCSIM